MSLNPKNGQYSVDAHRQAISPNIMLYIFLESLIQGEFNDARYNTDNLREHIPICEFIRLIFGEQAYFVTYHLMMRTTFYISWIFPILSVALSSMHRDSTYLKLQFSICNISRVLFFHFKI